MGNYELWASLPLSPQDQQEIAGLFKGLPLKVTSRGAKYVEDSAKSHPIVMHSFFGSKQVLLEPLDSFVARAALAPELRKYYAPGSPFLERDDAIAKIIAALKSGSKRVIAARGPGGTGKTRLLIEACRRVGERCFFLNPDVRQVAEHFDELLAARGSVIVVDEAQDSLPTLGILLDFCDRDERLKGQFRFIVAGRPTVWPQVEELLLKKVPGAEVERLNLEALKDALPLLKGWGYDKRDARQLARLGNGNPMWLTFAHEAVQTGADLSSLTRSGVAAHYVRNRLGEVNAEHLDTLLGTLAALAPFNVESAADIALASKMTGMDQSLVSKAVEELVSAGVAQKGGRLLRIRPDILADHFLRTLLIDGTGRSTEANGRLLDGAADENVAKIFQNLAKAEAMAGGDLLAPVVKEAMTNLPQWNNLERIAALSNLKGLGFVRPADAIKIASLLFEHPRGTDTVEVRGLLAIPREVDFTHREVIDAAVEFAYPALGNDGTFHAAAELLEGVIRDEPESGPAKNAIGKLSEATSWQDRYKAAWLELVIEWCDRRTTKLLSEDRARSSEALLDFFSVPIGNVLAVRYSVTRYENRTISLEQGLINPMEPIRRIRLRAIEVLRQLLESDWQPAVQIGVTIAKGVVTQILVQLPRYTPEARRYFLSEIAALEGAILTAAETGDLRSLLQLDELQGWISRAPLGRAARALGRDLGQALSSRASTALALRVFGTRQWREPIRESFLEIGRSLVASFGPERLVRDLAAMIRLNGDESGRAHGALVAFAEAEPEEATGILLAGLAHGAPETGELKLLSCLFAGIRAASDDQISSEVFVRLNPSVAAQGFSRLAWAAPKTPFGRADRELLVLAAQSAEAATVQFLARAAGALDDGSGQFLTEMSFAVLAGGFATEGLPSLVHAWNDHVSDRDEVPPDFDLPKLLMEVAGLPDLLSYGQSWELEELIGKAANAREGFLADFLAKRLRALHTASQLANFWFYEAGHFSETLSISPKEVAGTATTVLNVATELDILGYFLDQLMRDLFLDDVSAAAATLAEWSRERLDAERLSDAAELLREFPFSEAKLVAVESILSLSLDLSSDDREKVESALSAALGGYLVSGNDTGFLTERKEMASDFANKKASPLNRPFYRRLAKSIQQYVEHLDRRYAERDLD